ncbi:PKD domain-containing protein, partial [Hymenobacter arcticus]
MKIAFTNLSVGSTAYRWDFGDGTTSTAAAPPAHTYAVPGAYAIRLVATGPTYADSTQQETAAATTCPSYCVSTAWGGNEDSPLYFTRVALADMDNREERGPRVGYRDYTRYVATVRQGQTARLRAETLRWSGKNGHGESNFPLSWKQKNQLV